MSENLMNVYKKSKMKIKVSLDISVQYKKFLRGLFLVYFEIILRFSVSLMRKRRLFVGLPLQIHGHQKFYILFKEQSKGFCCYYAGNSVMYIVGFDCNNPLR